MFFRTGKGEHSAKRVISENRRAYKAKYNRRRKEDRKVASLSATTPITSKDIVEPEPSTIAVGFESVGVEAKINFPLNALRGPEEAQILKRVKQDDEPVVVVSVRSNFHSAEQPNNNDSTAARPLSKDDSLSTRPLSKDDSLSTRPSSKDDRSSTHPRSQGDSSSTRPRRQDDRSSTRSRHRDDHSSIRHRRQDDRYSTRTRNYHDRYPYSYRGDSNRQQTVRGRRNNYQRFPVYQPPPDYDWSYPTGLRLHQPLLSTAILAQKKDEGPGKLERVEGLLPTVLVVTPIVEPVGSTRRHFDKEDDSISVDCSDTEF